MTRYNIALLPGDGIGPEITEQAVLAIDAAGAVAGIDPVYERFDASAARWKRTGSALTDAEFGHCKAADAIFLGAIGLPEAMHPDGTEVAGDVIFALRFGLDLYAGVRPVRSFDGVPGRLADDGGIDYVVVRENIEGLYASRGGGTTVRDEIATDILVISRKGTEKVVRRAFGIAVGRQKARGRGDPREARVTCVDKSNVLSSYAFFRKVFDETAREFPQIAADRVYVDAMTAYQVTRPRSLDVLVAENMFGDIISDLSAATVGGLGMAPSGDIGDRHAMFQPAHGTAPDIAGQNVANPAAAVLSAAMLLRWLGEERADEAAIRGADLIDDAVTAALASGEARTRDIGGTASTGQAGKAIADRIRSSGQGPSAWAETQPRTPGEPRRRSSRA